IQMADFQNAMCNGEMLKCLFKLFSLQFLTHDFLFELSILLKDNFQRKIQGAIVLRIKGQ
ncbi:hypothetical protein, partial [Escherichia coli]|uniref:hypothetical protein n=1 Tax=Escherichia coli TaxID=562 RepID=UPI003985625E